MTTEERVGVILDVRILHSSPTVYKVVVRTNRGSLPYHSASLSFLDEVFWKGAVRTVVMILGGDEPPFGWKVACDPDALIDVLYDYVHLVAETASVEWVLGFARRAAALFGPKDLHPSHLSMLFMVIVSKLTVLGPEGLGCLVHKTLLSERLIDTEHFKLGALLRTQLLKLAVIWCLKAAKRALYTRMQPLLEEMGLNPLPYVEVSAILEETLKKRFPCSRELWWTFHAFPEAILSEYYLESVLKRNPIDRYLPGFLEAVGVLVQHGHGEAMTKTVQRIEETEGAGKVLAETREALLRPRREGSQDPREGEPCVPPVPFTLKSPPSPLLVSCLMWYQAPEHPL
jgi:hypothetical protein